MTIFLNVLKNSSYVLNVLQPCLAQPTPLLTLASTAFRLLSHSSDRSSKLTSSGKLFLIPQLSPLFIISLYPLLPLLC